MVLSEQMNWAQKMGVPSSVSPATYLSRLCNTVEQLGVWNEKDVPFLPHSLRSAGWILMTHAPLDSHTACTFIACLLITQE